MIRDRGLYGLLCGLVLVAVVGAAQGESTAEQEEYAVRSYLGLVFQKLESHKRYPRIAERSGLNGRVVLRFTVRWDGEVLNPEVIEVAGHDSFRKAALQALARVGQLPQFPDEIGRRELVVEVPITYKLDLKGEIWWCFAMMDYEKTTVLFTLTRERGGSDGSGEVAVAGITHTARFRVAGLNRRWDFGYDEIKESYLYAFVIEPDGTGLYLDFSTSSDGAAKPRNLFKCLMLP